MIAIAVKEFRLYVVDMTDGILRVAYLPGHLFDLYTEMLDYEYFLIIQLLPSGNVLVAIGTIDFRVVSNGAEVREALIELLQATQWRKL